MPATATNMNNMLMLYSPEMSDLQLGHILFLLLVAFFGNIFYRFKLKLAVHSIGKNVVDTYIEQCISGDHFAANVGNNVKPFIWCSHICLVKLDHFERTHLNSRQCIFCFHTIIIQQSVHMSSLFSAIAVHNNHALLDVQPIPASSP